MPKIALGMRLWPIFAIPLGAVDGHYLLGGAAGAAGSRAEHPPQMSGAPTPARAAIPPLADFDPLGIDVLKNATSRALVGRVRFWRCPSANRLGVAKLLIRYGFYKIQDVMRAHDKSRNFSISDLWK